MSCYKDEWFSVDSFPIVSLTCRLLTGDLGVSLQVGSAMVEKSRILEIYLNKINFNMLKAG